jgi:hypothetical protein
MYVINVQEFRIMGVPSALWDFVFTVCLGACLTIGMGALAAAQQNGTEFNNLLTFEIAAQPLAQALDAYARATGMAALADQELIAGRRSASVKGRLTPDQALRILLAGSGLSASYASGAAFTLQPTNEATVTEQTTSQTGDGLGRGRQIYFADLQDALTRVLCRDPETRPGRYRLGLQLWIGANGRVLASHLLDSTGDDRRDAVVTELLGAATVAAPPAELPEPVTIVLRPYPAEHLPDCLETGRHHE